MQRLQQALQFLASYTVIRKVLRWLASTLLAYGAAAILARPDPEKVLRGTIIPTVHGSREFLSLTVAVIGTTLSAYLYTWQSNQEVEEKVAKGKVRESERRGTSSSELQRTRWDTLVGMFFSSLVLYSILLSTGATLHEAGTFDVETAAQAARALRPLAGGAAEALFAAGIVGVGFLAGCVHGTRGADELPWPQSHEGSRVGRYRSRLLDAAAPFHHPAGDERQEAHGSSRERRRSSASRCLDRRRRARGDGRARWRRGSSTDRRNVRTLRIEYRRRFGGARLLLVHV